MFLSVSDIFETELLQTGGYGIFAFDTGWDMVIQFIFFFADSNSAERGPV